MKDTEKVVRLFAELKAEIETPYELARIEKLEYELANPPQIEILDEKHQRFDGVTFSKLKNGRYHANIKMHKYVWAYYFGAPFDGYDIHHKDRTPANNDITNLQALAAGDHTKIHSEDMRCGRKKKIFTCTVCGKEFPAYDCSASENHFCSKKCQNVFKKYRQTERTCVICGSKFPARMDKPTQTCSAQCAGKLIAQNVTPRMVSETCPVCGKVFLADSRGRSIYCSRGCARKADYLRRRETRQCVICGKPFDCFKDAKTQTCSNVCRAKLGALKKVATNQPNSDSNAEVS